MDRRGRQHNPTHLGLREKAAIGIFFSGHWCPPSREFTPDLIDAYDMWARQKKFEIIFCSSDQTEEEYRDYLGEMPWKVRSTDPLILNEPWQPWLRLCAFRRCRTRTRGYGSSPTCTRSAEFPRW